MICFPLIFYKEFKKAKLITYVRAIRVILARKINQVDFAIMIIVIIAKKAGS